MQDPTPTIKELEEFSLQDPWPEVELLLGQEGQSCMGGVCIGQT